GSNRSATSSPTISSPPISRIFPANSKSFPSNLPIVLCSSTSAKCFPSNSSCADTLQEVGGKSINNTVRYAAFDCPKVSSNPINLKNPFSRRQPKPPTDTTSTSAPMSPPTSSAPSGTGKPPTRP